jgi:hypothetical protein
MQDEKDAQVFRNRQTIVLKIPVLWHGDAERTGIGRNA